MGNSGPEQRGVEPVDQLGELHRAGLRYAPVGVAHVGLDGRWLWVNERLCSLLGYSEEELTRLTFQAITHPEDLETDLERVRRLLRGEDTRYAIEKRYLRKDGSSFWAKLSVTLLRDESGKPLQFISVVDDITQEKLLAEELRLTSCELEQRNGDLQAYTQSLAHELRAPLRILAGYVEMLPEYCVSDPGVEFTRVIRVIQSNAQRMRDMVDALLRLAEYGYRNLDMAEVDMSDLAREAIDFHMLNQGMRDVEIDLRPLPKVYADRALMRHVWDNLVSNALKYTRTRSDTRIRIEGSTSGGGRVAGSGASLNNSPDGLAVERVTYTVQDNGIGFDQCFAKQIFRPFQRVCEPEIEGLGVGLALVERIVQRHGGSVEAHGECDRGATFSFTLPRQQNAVGAPVSRRTSG